MKLDQRFVLALVALVSGAGLLSYIVVRFGDKTEILTLVIGIIGGALITAPLGYYFGAAHTKTPTGTTTAVTEAIITTTNPES